VRHTPYPGQQRGWYNHCSVYLQSTGRYRRPIFFTALATRYGYELVLQEKQQYPGAHSLLKGIDQMAIQHTLQNSAIDVATDVLHMTTEAGSGHATSALSLVHIVTTLTNFIMRYDPNDPHNPNSDRIVLSEGHAAPVVYAAFEKQGVTSSTPKDGTKPLSRDYLQSLRDIGSELDGHPHPDLGFHHLDVATGSLGQGLSCAAGLALAARLQNRTPRFYVIVGDGEAREGQVWEALDFIQDHNLASVVPIFNCNGLGQSDPVSGQQSQKVLQAKLSAANWQVQTVNGHDTEQLLKTFLSLPDSDKPTAVMCKTVKGWGVSDLQVKNLHGKPLQKDKIEKAIQELNALRPRIDDTLEPAEVSRPSPQSDHMENMRSSEQTAKRLRSSKPSFHDDQQQQPPELSTRKAFGMALAEAGKIEPRVVALDGDVKNSTYSQLFADQFPDRYFEARIAEQNMISTANGLAVSGLIPFASSFSRFLVRGYDQFEMALMTPRNLNLVGSHSGANIGPDGPSQMGMSDLNYMRAFTKVTSHTGTPLLRVYSPACAVCAWHQVMDMVTTNSPCYMRTLRPNLPLLYADDHVFTFGTPELLRGGTDGLIAATGYMVHVALRVAQALEKQGLSIGVADCHSLPVDPDVVLDYAARHSGKICTLEDNYNGGIGSEIAEIVASSAPTHIANRVYPLYVDKTPKSGRKPEDVLEYLDLNAEAVQARLKQFIEA